MGVKGLWELLAPIGRRVSMDTVANKTLAIDVSIWLTQFLYAMRDSEGELIRNAHLLGILRRCCKLIFYNVKPIFVFDGATPQLKRKTLQSRQNQRNKQKLRLRRIAEKILLNELKLKNLKDKKEKESETTRGRLSSEVDSRYLYNQYVDTILKGNLERSNAENEERAEQLDNEAAEDKPEQCGSFLEEHYEQAGPKDTEENEDNDEDERNILSEWVEDMESAETEEYEVPDINEMSPETLASLPPEMFETIVSEIRSRVRNLHREEFIKVENDPVGFSQKQLEGFLRLSLTKKEVMKARAASYSHLGQEGRRIASEPGKNYTLTKICDSMPENGHEHTSNSGTLFRDCFHGGGNDNEELSNKVDEGLDWTKSVSGTKRHSESNLTNLQLKNVREPVMNYVNEEFCQETAAEDEEIQWVACPPEPDESFVQQEKVCSTEVDLDGLEKYTRDKSSSHSDGYGSADLVSHIDFRNTEGDRVMTVDSDSTESSLLRQQQNIQSNSESSSLEKNCQYFESIPKFVVSSKSEVDDGLESRQEDLGSFHQWNKAKAITSEASETIHSSYDVEDTSNIYAEEEFLNEKNMNTEISQDFILPDEKLDNLFQEFERERGELRQQYVHLKSGSDVISDEMYEEIRALLRMLGIPYIQAPMEAEAQCAYYNQVGLVEGVVTEDSDAFLFGAQTVFRNIFEDRKYVEQYEMDDIKRCLGLDRNKLILLSLLLGSDYTQGIHGVGVVNATEIIRAFPTFEQLKEFAQWANQFSLDEEKYPFDPQDPNFVKNEFFSKHRKMRRNWIIHDSFPSKHVMDAYSYPIVDTDAVEFHCQRPNIAQLVEFCRAKFGWDSEKVKKLVIPILKAYDARNVNQTRIEEYFHPMRFAKIKSKRLETAVRGITSAVDEEMFLSTTDEKVKDANSVSESQVTGNSKKKRKKTTQGRRKKASSVESDP